MNPDSMLYYHDGQLHMEGVSLTDIQAQVETPFYCYSRTAIEQRAGYCRTVFERIGGTVHYAVKANGNLAILKLMVDAGLGADIVSGGELQRVLVAGMDPAKVIFSGVGKRKDEMRAALQVGIGQFNIESLPELWQLEQLCREEGYRANVSLRVNPDVRVDTHRHINTGGGESKFGIPEVQLEKALGLIQDSNVLCLRGLALHIGSQILEVEPYREACRKMRRWVEVFRARGVTITHLDLGGGFGIDYGDGRILDPAVIADVMQQLLGDLDVQFAVEPGRFLVGPAGILVSRVIYRKEVEPTPFLILDAGMNDLLRPALYQAEHPLKPVRQSEGGGVRRCHVVGPVCESGDRFLQDVILPPIEAGDGVVLLQAGAYAAAMSSGYNGRALVAEVMVERGCFGVIRQPVSTLQMMAWESVPELSGG